jgi:altronate dehydratase
MPSESREQGRRPHAILEKLLGAMAKSGSTNLVDVLHYAKPVADHDSSLAPVSSDRHSAKVNSGHKA